MAMGKIAYFLSSKTASLIPLVLSGSAYWVLFFLAYDFGSAFWFAGTPQYVPGNIYNEVIHIITPDR